MPTVDTVEEQKKVLPLLSDSLYTELREIFKSTCCQVSGTLVLAHESIRDQNDTTQVSDFCRMVTIRNKEDGDLELSYLPKGREPIYTESGKWSTNGRQTGKVGKIALALLECFDEEVEFHQVKMGTKWYNYDPETNLVSSLVKGVAEYNILTQAELDEMQTRVEKVKVKRCPDKAYEEFTNNLKSFYESDVDIQLVEGDRIAECYDYENYYEGKGQRGTLWDSCMRGVGSYVLRLYSESSPKIRLLVAFKEDKVVARALVWDTNEGIYMDRVYYYEDFYFNKLTDYAREQGWMYKANPNSGMTTPVMKIVDNEYVEVPMPKFYVEGVAKIDHKFPYLDSLKLYDENEGVIHNDWDGVFTHELEATGGSCSRKFSSSDFHTCVVSGKKYYTGRTVVVEQGRVHMDHAVGDYHGRYILKSEAVELSNNKGWATRTDPGVVETAENGWMLKSMCEFNDETQTWGPRQVRKYTFEDFFESSAIYNWLYADRDDVSQSATTVHEAAERLVDAALDVDIALPDNTDSIITAGVAAEQAMTNVTRVDSDPSQRTGSSGSIGTIESLWTSGNTVETRRVSGVDYPSYVDYASSYSRSSGVTYSSIRDMLYYYGTGTPDTIPESEPSGASSNSNVRLEF